MKKSHRASKRRSVKIQKVVRKKKKAHRNKMKKEAKKLRAMGIRPRPAKHRLTIPNMCPFKEDLLRKVIRHRQRERDDEETKRLMRKEMKETKRVEREEMVMRGLNHAEEERKIGLEIPKSLLKTSWGDARSLRVARSPWEARHMYYRELNKVIGESDVIVEVLDARDPMGCRSRVLERRIIGGQSNVLGGSKKLILLINKIDLIPPDVLSSWMHILRREYPVIAFKASTQKQKRKLRADGISLSRVGKRHGRRATNRSVGADALMGLLKNYSRNQDIKTKIVVGFIGYPNTGKSSVINSLKRIQAVGVGRIPGFTKQLQQVKLDSNITLIDSPGVILNEDGGGGPGGDGDLTNDFLGDNNDDDGLGGNRARENRLALRNALKMQDVDCVEAVKYVVEKCSMVKLMRIYDLSGDDVRVGDDSLSKGEKFLFGVAETKSLKKRGGLADIERAARRVIQDWNSGKIPFYVRPPTRIVEREEKEQEVTFVDGFSPEFDVNGLLNQNETNAVNVVRRKLADASQYLVLEDGQTNGDEFEIHMAEDEFVGGDDEDVEMGDGNGDGVVMENFVFDPTQYDQVDDDGDLSIDDDAL